VKSDYDFNPKSTSTMLLDDSDSENVDSMNLHRLQLSVSTVTFYTILITRF